MTTENEKPKEMLTGVDADLANAGYKPIEVPRTAPDTSNELTEREAKHHILDRPDENAPPPILKIRWDGDPDAAFRSVEDALEATNAARANSRELTEAKQRQADRALQDSIDKSRTPDAPTQTEGEKIRADADRQHQQMM